VGSTPTLTASWNFARKKGQARGASRAARIEFERDFLAKRNGSINSPQEGFEVGGQKQSPAPSFALVRGKFLILIFSKKRQFSRFLDL